MAEKRIVKWSEHVIRIATMVVMYTLKRHGTKLLGPINHKLYASFAPKRHAFAVAQREANKRFSGGLIGIHFAAG